MALIEQTIIDKYEIVGPYKKINVREDHQIVDDVTGEIKVRGNFRRHILFPGDDVSSYSDGIQAVAKAEWTDEIKTAYAAHVEANRPV